MGKNQTIFVEDAVFKLQMFLLEGIQNEQQLFAAGSLISKSDYEDVVTERSIANICGYPLCRNALPSDRPRKGRYRISLKEHKVYDLHETYMYCSSSCVVNSKTFSGSLQDERVSVLDPGKVNNVLRLFEDMNLESMENLGTDGGDLGLSVLKIQEKTGTGTGEVSLKQFAGPSNAIEGYVPKPRDSDSRGSSSRKISQKGSKASNSKFNNDKNLIFNKMDFMSEIIMPDEYSVSKVASGQSKTTAADHQIKPTAVVEKTKRVGGKVVRKDDQSKTTADHQIKPTAVVEKPERVGSQVVRRDDDSIQELSASFESSLNLSTSGKEKDLRVKEVVERQFDVEQNDSDMKSIQLKGEASRVDANDDASTSNLDDANVDEKSQVEKATVSCKTKPKSSLKSAGEKKLSRSVTWADEKANSSGSKDLCEFEEFGDIKNKSDLVGDTDDDEVMLRRASAEACAMALNQASEAVASGDADVTDAFSEAGIIILPRPHEADEEVTAEDDDMPEETDSVTLKWPRKPGISDVDVFDSDDSWYDPPPEGFSLTLSPFATMWNALFTWITSSSLAYIYGRDESFQEEYLSVSGREYPHKIILADGRSSEIKQTLASCLGRALPTVAAELRLPIPISTIEQAAACLLDTMSFVDALPAFKTRQWQVIALLLIDALSVCRIPALTSYMTDRRALFHKVLHGTQLGMEEYEILKDHIVPLGRAPHFSAQSGA